jgi:hypothetical protein
MKIIGLLIIGLGLLTIGLMLSTTVVGSTKNTILVFGGVMNNVTNDNVFDNVFHHINKSISTLDLYSNAVKPEYEYKYKANSETDNDEDFSLEDQVNRSSSNQTILVPINHNIVSNAIEIKHNLTIKGDSDFPVKLNVSTVKGVFKVLGNTTLNFVSKAVSNVDLTIKEDSGFPEDFSLEDQVNRSSSNQTILVPSNHNVVSNAIEIKHNLTIKGDSDFPVKLNVSTVKGVFKVLGNATLTLENVEIDGLNIDNKCEIIHNNGNLILINCIFDNNSVKDLTNGSVGDRGYVIYNLENSNATINNCTFNNNNLSFGDVIASELSGYITIYKSHFKNNQGKAWGSVLKNNQSGNVIINESVFDSNRGRWGGVIYNALFSNKRLKIENSNFTNNFADTNGGAIYNMDGAGFNMYNCSLKGNTAQEEGGGVYNSNCDDFTIETSVFTNNSAVRGGGVYTSSAVSNIGNSGFYNNSAGSGGAIYNANGKKYSYVYDHSFFENNGDNKLNSYGGAITLNNANYQFTQSYFGNNSASKGAAIYLGENTQIYLKDDIFRFNKFNNDSQFSSSYGGAICNIDGDRIDIVRTKFLNNSANSGASIFSRSHLSINDSQFIENFASSDGGAIVTGSGNNPNVKINIIKTIFEKNKAQKNGGGVYNLGVGTLIQDSTFNENIADKGGAVYNTGNNFSVNNSSFNNNIANSAGRTFYFDALRIYLNNSHINNQRINLTGSEVYASDLNKRYISISYDSA